MNLLKKNTAVELRKKPFGKWILGKTTPDVPKNDLLAVPLPYYKRDEDPFEIIRHMDNLPTRVVIFRKAFYLGLQGNSSAELKKSLKNFSQKTIDRYADIINYIHANYDVARKSKNPIGEILTELIINAFEASLRHVDPKFKIDRIKNTLEQVERLKEILKTIEEIYPHIMQFSISLAKELIREEQTEEDPKTGEKKIIIPEAYKINSMKFIIISPPITVKDRSKLEEKLNIHSEYKANGRGYAGYLTEKYDPDAKEGHELGVLNILNVIDNHWEGAAKLFYEFSEKETRTNLVINTRR